MFSAAVVNTRVVLRSSRSYWRSLNVYGGLYKKNGMVSFNWNRTFTTVQKQAVADDNSEGHRVAKSNEATFEQLFKASKFVDILDPVGKIVDGKIIAVDGPNLYVDFGGKFHGVAIKPYKFSERYIKGARVKVLIKDLEVGMHFLGSNTDTSLLEASIEIIGLL